MEISKCWYKDVCNVNECSSCIRFLEMSALVENSGLVNFYPSTLRAPACDADAFYRLRDIKDNIVEFVENGNNLYITSSYTGNGKTTWATKLLLKYFDSIWAGNGFKTRGLFIHTPTFLLKCKDFGNIDENFNLLKSNIPSVDLVVWDDIASTSLSPFDYNQLLMYIDIRVSNRLSNIYTGNLVDRKLLQKALGDKLTSRILGNNTEIIVFNGGDKR